MTDQRQVASGRRLLAVSLFLSGTLGAQTPTSINLAATTSPTTAQPGVTVLTLTCSALPAGTITAANLSVTLQVAPGTTGPSLTASVTGFSSLPAAGGQIKFQVNGTNVSAPTPYLVSVSGKTSTGTSFVSAKPASLTINPAASVLSLAPASGLPGQSLSVTMTGQYTNYVQGSTTANFGAGISVGGGAEGQSGPVTVTSATTAVAQLVIDAAATAGARTVTVATGVQQASLAGGFTVTGIPAITLLNPSSAQQGQTNFPVIMTGQFTHFTQGTTTATFGAGIVVVSLTVNSPTQATAVLDVALSAVPGARTVTLTTNTETASLVNGFTVTTPGAPAITQLSPNTAQQGQANVPVTITGQNTHFAAGTTQVSFGSGITVASVSVANTTTLTANINVAANAAAAAYTVTVTTGTETATLANGFTVQHGPPVITLTAPTNLSFLNISPTTVNGTVSDPTATVTVNSIAAPVSGGSFSIQLPLAEGPNPIVATATSVSSGLVSTASIQVTLDTTPPHVTITSPADQFVTTASSVSVSGSVNDVVVGTVNAQQAKVTVNGITAQVSNRTFMVDNIPLTMGANVIHAVAVDQAGNAATTQITVTRQAPAAQPQIQLTSGNNQTGVIGTFLPAPLVAALTDGAGNPVANQTVIFKVIQNNGMVSAGNVTPASSVVATTNAQGQAQVQWTLGLRAGAGSDSVEAYAVGFSGTAVFTATSNLGVAGKIVIDSGNNQIGVIGQPLPKPLIAVVVDSGNNRLPNVPVTFTVKQGGGSLAIPSSTNFTLGQSAAGAGTVTSTTDSDGRVAATLTLGYQEGNSNNLIEANFSGNTAFPASFTASGMAEGPVANTTISGVVLDNSNVPIPGVTIRAVLTNLLNSNSGSVSAAATVQTDAQGQFTIPAAPVGFVKLLVDGSTAQSAGTYPSLDYDLVTIAGQNNTVGMPIYLLPLKTANQLCVTAATGGGTLTIPEAPGFSLTFGPGQVTFPGGSQTGCVSVTVVHPDRVPMQPGFGQQPRFIVTIQPSGALFSPPAPITLPNVDGLAPRAVTEMYSFDHDIGSFVAIGTGTVSDDGQVIRSSQGVGVLKAGWHCGGDPNSTGVAADCPICFFCPGLLANCQPQGNGTSCGNGGTCQFQEGCVCPAGEVFDPTSGSCVNNGPCSSGYTLVGSQCCLGTTCVQPCSPGLTFNPITGTCVNNGPCAPGYTLSGGQCCPPTGVCFPPQCPPGEVFDPTTGTCISACGNCTSNNPCIDALCATNNQCVSTPNQFCQNACNGATSGSCSVGAVPGMCDPNGNCNLCTALGNGASCTCGGSGAVGMCSNGQCTSNGQDCNNPYLQLTLHSTSDPPPPQLPPAGLHSFVGCFGSACDVPTDTATANAIAISGRIAGLAFQGPTAIAPAGGNGGKTNISGPALNVTMGQNSVTFSGQSSRSITTSCGSQSQPNYPPCLTQPAPPIAYSLQAMADVEGTPEMATLPSNQFIQQDPIDVLRQEYLDFGNTAFTLFPWPGQSLPDPNVLPMRSQIAPPPDPLFNWGYFQDTTPNYPSASGLIAVNGPPGADVMGPLLDDLTLDFDILTANLDQQILAVGLPAQSATDRVVATRTISLNDISKGVPYFPYQQFSYPFTGGTDPVSPNVCDGHWATTSGIPYADSNGNTVIAPSTYSPAAGYRCVGNILAGSDPNGNPAKSATPANVRAGLPTSDVDLRGFITSGYRNPQKQKDIKSSTTSYHTQGRALDINPIMSVPYKTNVELRCLLQAVAIDALKTIDPANRFGWVLISAQEVLSESGIVDLACNNTIASTPPDHVHIAR